MEEDYPDEAELELGLGLGLTLNCGGTGGYSKVTSVSGTKRAADFAAPSDHTSSKLGSQIVGWPPIRTYRMNSLVNQARIPNYEVDKGVGGNDESNISLENMGQKSNKNDTAIRERGHFGFVKVNMDGLQIGRKVDLKAHTCYETLAQTLEEMFWRPSTTINSICGEKQKSIQPSKLLNGSSEFVLTYEDKEGDWMLVGDVPWSSKI